MGHYREPVKYTCPDIDSVIKSIKDTIRLCSRIKGNETQEELISLFSEIDNILYGNVDMLEQLRKSNDSLRNWGIDEANKVDELEMKIDEEN